MRALPRLKESIYEKDHDETERRKGSELGGRLGNPGSGLDRVGSMKLGDNLRGMT